MVSVNQTPPPFQADIPSRLHGEQGFEITWRPSRVTWRGSSIRPEQQARDGGYGGVGRCGEQ